MNSVRKRILCAASALVVAALAPGCALAQSTRFNIPTGPLAASLSAYAEAANRQIVFSREELKRFRAPSLNGVYSADQALDRLLHGTGLIVTETPSGVLVIAPPPAVLTRAVDEKPRISPKQPEPIAQQSADSDASLDEIVVTARRREENLQTTPVAITAVSTETLEQRNIVTLNDVARLAPSLTVYANSGGLGQAGIYMRGIGYGDNSPGQDSPIAVYIDGVIAGRTAIAMMGLVEPERVEVLRGPQGTLFGRNTSGGAILVTTHAPSDEFSGEAEASYGTYSASRFQARIDTGLLGDSGVKISAAFQHRRQDGTFDAPALPRHLDPGAETSDAYWIKVVGEWGRLSATLSADYSELSGTPSPLQILDADPNVRTFLGLSTSAYGGPPYVITTKRLSTVSEAFRGEQYVWTEGVALTLNYRLNDKLAIKTTSAIRAYNRNDSWGLGPADIRGNAGTVAAPRITSFDGLFALADRSAAQRQQSHELQFLGTVGNLDYVAGLYYFKESAWDFARTRLPSVAASGLTAFEFLQNRIFSVDSKSLAGFAQLDWRPNILDRKLQVSGGVRWTKDTREFLQAFPLVRSADLETKNTSFLVSGNYKWSPNSMTFIRYSTGYRAGGFNARAVANVDPTFSPEKMKSLEVGFKQDFFNNRVRLNGSAFLNTYHDLQVGIFVAPANSSSGGNIAINADARYKGFELELQAVPVRGLTVSASVGYVDTNFKKYPRQLDAGGRVTAGCTPTLSASGSLIAQNCAAIATPIFEPKTSADLSVHYVLPEKSYGEWSFFASYSYKSRIEFNSFDLPSSPHSDLIAQKGYGLLSARIALSKIPLSGNVVGQVAIFGDNLTDKSYHMQGSDFVTYAGATFGKDRTVGVEAKVQF